MLSSRLSVSSSGTSTISGTCNIGGLSTPPMVGNGSGGASNGSNNRPAVDARSSSTPNPRPALPAQPFSAFGGSNPTSMMTLPTTTPVDPRLSRASGQLARTASAPAPPTARNKPRFPGPGLGATALTGLLSGAPREKSRVPPDTCFIPSPKITFLVDEADGLVCQICRTTTMGLHDKRFAIRDCDPALLPCGHAYGHACLRRWLRAHAECPSCRFQLTHKSCGHKLRPRVVDRESVRALPRTLPEGGRVKPSCPECRMGQLARYEDETFAWLAKEFQRARTRFETEGTPEAEADMRSAKRMLEDAPRTSEQEKRRIAYSDW